MRKFPFLPNFLRVFFYHEQVLYFVTVFFSVSINRTMWFFFFSLSLNVELRRILTVVPCELQHTTTFKYTFEEVLFTKASLEKAIHQEATQKWRSPRKLSFWELWKYFWLLTKLLRTWPIYVPMKTIQVFMQF